MSALGLSLLNQKHEQLLELLFLRECWAFTGWQTYPGEISPVITFILFCFGVFFLDGNEHARLLLLFPPVLTVCCIDGLFEERNRRLTQRECTKNASSCLNKAVSRLRVTPKSTYVFICPVFWWGKVKGGSLLLLFPHSWLVNPFLVTTTMRIVPAERFSMRFIHTAAGSHMQKRTAPPSVIRILESPVHPAAISDGRDSVPPRPATHPGTEAWAVPLLCF